MQNTLGTKFIFITGGVMSSLGKGIASSSLATLLKSCDYKISVLKIDPYINVDPGTMSPLEHGEVFVTSDGAETDLDIGHYERFLDTNLTKKNNFTTGQIYQSVIENERAGKYLGKTIQVIPHITNEIKDRIYACAKSDDGSDVDFLIVEIGGTVGDIESMPFLETLRQMRHELGSLRVCTIHVTLIPYIKTTDELKTKPTQHSVQELRRIGISPQIILARSEMELDLDIKRKIALSCDVDEENVIADLDAKSIYQCPLMLQNEGILDAIWRIFKLDNKACSMQTWHCVVSKIISPKKSVKIAFVGKYLGLKESYKSLIEALIHAGAHLDTKVCINWIDSEDSNLLELLKDSDGILIPGGFGMRGISGKIKAINFARTQNVPFLGICLGMQLSVLEFLQNVAKINANSTEFDKDTKEPAIYLIEDFLDQDNKRSFRTYQSPLGGTMRLGEYECILKEGSKIQQAYGANNIRERHRHRYEVNPHYISILQKHGMEICATNEDKSLVEGIEIPSLDFFIAVQFHPEFNSRLMRPSPIILDFLKAASRNKNKS
ncbi:MAG: CTP synthase [Helicobacter sp.]|nr:CTP synthase [Helicobacter sp.]